jgi:glycosyltransferase involved in cell wall biosynthesis
MSTKWFLRVRLLAGPRQDIFTRESRARKYAAMMNSDTQAPERVVIVAARDEADRIVETLEALQRAFPGSRLVVASDGSKDDTSRRAAEAGAEVASSDGRPRGKGGAMTVAARPLLPLAERPAPPTFVLCDGDLGASAERLVALAEAVETGRCDLAVASFARSEGGGFGIALGFARRAIRSLTGLELRAPISGQRAMRGELLLRLLPFADGFGMEIGMTVDAVRAGYRVEEVELDLAHRPTGRTLSGFVHRGRQLLAFARVYVSRRLRRRR